MQQGTADATLDELSRAAEARRGEARHLADRYNRTTWYRFVLVFFPVPFIVVLLRLQIEAWAYAAAGAAIVLSGAVLYVLDGRASAAVEAAERAAATAEQALAAARGTPTAADGRAAAPNAPA